MRHYRILSQLTMINYVFSDDAYVFRPWFQVASKRSTAPPAQQEFNTEISSMFEKMDWSYKDLKQMWTSSYFACSLKVRQAPVSLLYIAPIVVLHFKTWVENGIQVGSYFNFPSPSLDTYITS